MSAWFSLEILINHDDSIESRQFMEDLGEVLMGVAFDFTEDTPYDVHASGTISAPTPDGYIDELDDDD